MLEDIGEIKLAIEAIIVIRYLDADVNIENGTFGVPWDSCSSSWDFDGFTEHVLVLVVLALIVSRCISNLGLGLDLDLRWFLDNALSIKGWNKISEVLISHCKSLFWWDLQSTMWACRVSAEYHVFWKGVNFLSDSDCPHVKFGLWFSTFDCDHLRASLSARTMLKFEKTWCWARSWTGAWGISQIC